MPHKKIRRTKKRMREAVQLLAAVPPIKGEWRTVYACNECGRMYCHQYIPYGLGVGRGTRRCSCQLANRVPTTIVLQGPEVLKDPRYRPAED